ncbi:MAG: ABC transporter permease [Candidatus Kaiserbacteria bacterium]|nr:ABC transporter permease [Candidatus Kaiserbacteria bacterium]
MLIHDAFKTATRSLAHSKMRSILTMLGIVTGIASVIIIMSLGDSAKLYIVGQIQSMAPNMINVQPGAPVMGGAPSSVMGITIKTLKARDVEALEREPSITNVSPNVTGSSRIVYGNKSKSTLWVATTANIFKMTNLNFASGYGFTKADETAYKHVVVLGSKLAKDLFGSNVEPVGKTVRFENITFSVIGVLEPKGSGMFSMDEYALIPISVGQKQIRGIDYYQELNVQIDPAYDTAFVKTRMISILRASHQITDPTKDDFMVTSMDETLNMLGNIMSIFTIFLAAIASISLIVGGIGIMNIMLVSVTERTREIGLRKAVGATERDILEQFLIESVLLTMVGGLIGIAFGAVIVGAIYFVLSTFFSIGWIFAFPISAVLLALFVSTLSGLAFGIYPARQAARKNPIDSLRYE